MTQHSIDLEMLSLEYAADDYHSDHWHTQTDTHTELITHWIKAIRTLIQNSCVKKNNRNAQ